MCEICSSILKSQASLAKNKKARHEPAEVHGEETTTGVSRAWLASTKDRGQKPALTCRT